MGKTAVPSGVESAIRTFAKEFAQHCFAILTEAHARRHNPVDGLAVEVTGDELRLAAAEAMERCGWLRCVGARKFILTAKGLGIYADRERNLKETDEADRRMWAEMGG